MIQILPLGAGRDVGKSCILVTISGKKIMFDCGLHMGYTDDRKYPDFSLISKSGNYNDALNCIIISHFHLDHCGALPYFTEKCGYNGPIFMTYPTRCICPLLLEDMRKIVADKQGDASFFTSSDLMNCMKKVKTMSLFETVLVHSDPYKKNDVPIEIKAYYAGHVLGAAMFHVRVGENGTLAFLK